MTTFRIMSYHVNGFRTANGETDQRLSARVICSQQPDLVMLQQLGSPIAAGTLSDFSDQVALAAYGPDEEGACAFLSRFPLHNIQNFSLGHGGRCVRADLDLENERVHLYNLCLSFDPWQRRDQIRTLLSDQLLNNQTLPCATVVCGDFTLPLWGYGQIRISEHLRRARFPMWRANYPGNFPLWGRDRIYFRGPIRALAGTVLATAEARKASPHLPLVLTVETCDTRRFLQVKERLRIRKPSPICG
ncbi:endonuclease/exonuclease/phosphatase family protein [Malonomonas rubra]|uniref:endonuclease/exonuclease/phosphatase family protein n=1 Tax=Malonomonas rubra TaxID=57040 RepID=UPI0026EAD856|nr:endonuclease/exonuclease/phosphatase family protein [Malonomonas rubra]